MAISTAVSVVIAIAIIAMVGLVFFGSTLNTSVTTNTIPTRVTYFTTRATSSISLEGSNAASMINVETTNSSLGLKLILSVNSTSIPSQDAISMTASIRNTFPSMINLSAANDWAIQGLSSGPCDIGNSNNRLFTPVGFAVFKGSYGLNNITSAGSALPVWAMVECMVDLAFNGTKVLGALSNITSYSLLPQGANNPGNDSGSYVAYYRASNIPSPCNSTVCTYSEITRTVAKGVFPTRLGAQATIYAANGTGFYNSLGSSLPATYTLVAGDEWGQIVLLHFSVIHSNNLPIVGNFLSSTGYCTENDNPVPCFTSEFSQAFVFNCASEASTSSGCTTLVESVVGGSAPENNYTITVWYPYVNQSNEPSQDNCMFSVKGYTASPYAYCFTVNSTAFALSP